MELARAIPAGARQRLQLKELHIGDDVLELPDLLLRLFTRREEPEPGWDVERGQASQAAASAAITTISVVASGSGQHLVSDLLDPVDPQIYEIITI